MKDKFNSFLDDIVTRPSVAYAAFVSYFFLIVPLLCRAVFIFNLYVDGEYLGFFSFGGEEHVQGMSYIFGLFVYSIPTFIFILLLIFLFPTIVFLRKEKNHNYRLKYKSIFNSSLYKGLLFLGICLFGLWTFIPILCILLLLLCLLQNFKGLFLVLLSPFLCLPIFIVFLALYIPFQISSFIYAIYNIFVLLFTFRA